MRNANQRADRTKLNKTEHRNAFSLAHLLTPSLLPLRVLRDSVVKSNVPAQLGATPRNRAQQLRAPAQNEPTYNNPSRRSHATNRPNPSSIPTFGSYPSISLAFPVSAYVIN